MNLQIKQAEPNADGEILVTATAQAHCPLRVSRQLSARAAAIWTKALVRAVKEADPKVAADRTFAEAVTAADERAAGERRGTK